MNLNLSGSRAYILAASSGLGQAVATELAREGATVAISSRNKNRLVEAAKTICAEADRDHDAVQTIQCDLREPDQA